MNIRTIMTAAAALAFASTASAQEVETKAIEAKRIENGSQSIEPDKGYIFLHAPNRLNGIFVKTPDAADWAEYNEEWEEKFAKEVKNYPGRKKRYDAAMEVKRKTGRGNPGTEPIEPNRGNFSIGEIDHLRALPAYQPLAIFSLSNWLARKVRTRRGVIGTSIPVLGLRPTRSFLSRSTKLPKPEILTFSPLARASAILVRIASTNSSDSARLRPSLRLIVSARSA